MPLLAGLLTLCIVIGLWLSRRYRSPDPSIRFAACVTDAEAILAVDMLASKGIRAAISNPSDSRGRPPIVGVFPAVPYGYGGTSFYIWVKKSELEQAQGVLRGTTIELLDRPY